MNYNKDEFYRAPKDKVRVANAENPKMLYEQDNSKMSLESSKTETLTKQLASGKFLTEEELQYLAEKAPELFKCAEEAKRRVEQVKEKLKQVTSLEEAQALVVTTLSQVPKNAKYEQITNIMKEIFEQIILDSNFEDKNKEELNA
ncbi:MAG: hypothetical protein GX372_08730 [Ignavibacteria bacterium]|jgi:hypothetical protein|nr:hypothetical protein [Ignavibacteria bacterium]